MTRGELTQAQVDAITVKVPDAGLIEERALLLSPNRLAIVFGPGTNRDEAAACLQDAADFLTEAHYALTEAHAHWLWHTEIANDPNDLFSAPFWSRFYIDDAILRMYSSAESVAAFADLFLDVRLMKRGLTKKERKALRGESRLIGISRLFPRVESTGHLQTAIVGVANDANWRLMTAYRHNWVHEQRPRLEGLGITFRRRKRWRKDTKDETGNTWTLPLSPGDPPDVTVDQLFERTDAAYRLLRSLVEQCCADMEAELSSRERRLPSRVESEVNNEHGRRRVKSTRLVTREIDSRHYE
jgi:hypothetical protein